VRFVKARQWAVERLLWTRDGRLVAKLTGSLPHARVIELADSGWCLIGQASELTEDAVARLAKGAPYGLADVDPAVPPSERYVIALGHAVQISGLGDRIGMGETPEIAANKVLALFFACHEHHVEFQPIVDLATLKADEWECLFRLSPGMGNRTITELVEAAVVAKRPVDFDTFIMDVTLARIAQVAEPGPDGRRARYGVNLLPTTLLAPSFEAEAFEARVRAAGLSPRQIIVECTEQQAIHDVPRLKKQVKALRRLGFGFAVDDAGAGYASFTVIAALEPSIIKIDREIVSGIGNKDAEAKKALVEAFVAFSRRIGARVVAEGIENRRDLLALQDREVDFGQGYLLGRSSTEPLQPRHIRDVEDLTLVISTAGWDKPARARVATAR
jgi:EAL domain-containing protein (putative c-di-GMP-specific phosphodiesterase class I)